MSERVARLGSMHYRDADGRYCTATAGETIQVHPDYVELFDQLNVLLGQEPEQVEPEPDPPAFSVAGKKAGEDFGKQIVPKRRPGRPRKTEE